MCIDYRGLNKLIVKNLYPIPRIDDLIDQLRGAKVFSVIDLMQGYYQLQLVEEDRPKTAFVTPFGQYQFVVLPFGLSNAPAYFQSKMNELFSSLVDCCVLIYLDDILVFSKNPEEHLQHLRQVLEILRHEKFYGRLHKCAFFKKELKYLGHIVSAEGIRVDPKQIEKVNEWPVPTDVSEVRSFLGLANYFRKFIQGYSQLVLPLTALTNRRAVFEWTPECQSAFERVKALLTSVPVLKMPDWDRRFEVVTDASDFALGAVLLQDGHPIVEMADHQNLRNGYGYGYGWYGLYARSDPPVQPVVGTRTTRTYHPYNPFLPPVQPVVVRVLGPFGGLVRVFTTGP